MLWEIFNKFPRGWQVAQSRNTKALVGHIDNDYKQTSCGGEYAGGQADSRQWVGFYFR